MKKEIKKIRWYKKVIKEYTVNTQGLSYRKLAKAVGYNWGTLNKILTGKRIISEQLAKKYIKQFEKLKYCIHTNFLHIADMKSAARKCKNCKRYY